VRRYAEDTDVSVGKSRGEIDDLLRAWKCDGIQWTDHYDVGTVRLAGQTFAEVALPQLSRLLMGGADRLLPEGISPQD